VVIERCGVKDGVWGRFDAKQNEGILVSSCKLQIMVIEKQKASTEELMPFV